MVTRDEFLAALDVVNKYKIQIAQQFEDLNKVLFINKLTLVPIDLDTRLCQSSMSTRAIHVLYVFLDNVQNVNKSNELRFKHCNGINLMDLYNVRNAGKGTIEEIENYFFQAGVHYTKVKPNGK